jgi:hypothetical protein
MDFLSTVKRLDGYTHQGVVVPDRVRQTTPTKEACGTVWPNGEFGLGYAVKREESRPSAVNPAGGVSLDRQRDECAAIADSAEAALDLTSLPNSHKQSNRPETYGRKGLSGYGGKFIRNSGHLLQERYGKARLSFWTLTLPPMSAKDASVVACSWGETIRQLIQTLSRLLERQGLPTEVALVTELQTKRLQAEDAACLHVHLICVGRFQKGPWLISPKELRRWWLKRLNRVTAGSVDSMNCVDVKRVKKDAGNYLSKYMSKGADDITKYAEKVGWECVPRQWWNVSKAMRDAVKSGCIRSRTMMSIVDGMVHEHYFGDAGGAFKFVRMIEVKATEFQSFVVGYWGRMTREAVADLRDLAAYVKPA